MHLRAITEAFAAIGHEVQLVAVAGHGDAPTSLADVRLLPHPGRAEGLQREVNKLAFVDHVVAEMTAPICEFQPDVIYERLSLFGVAGVHIAARAACAHALEVNSLLAEEETEWRGLHLSTLAATLERQVLEQADLTIAVSDEVAAKIARVTPLSRSTVVPNGVEVERFRTMPNRDAARRALALPAAEHVACFVGALRPWHGVDLAIRAIADTEAMHLAIAGEGPIRVELAALAADLGVTHRVHFLGHLDHAGVASCLAACDVAVAPYPLSESFSFSPLKLYEYLAAGIPVVASRIGQIGDVLDQGRWGALVPPGDVPALRDAMVTAIESPAARHRAAAAREYALQHHGWAHRARQITDAVSPFIGRPEGANHALAR